MVGINRTRFSTLAITSPGYGNRLDDRVAAIDVLNAASFELEKMPLSRLNDFCVNGLMSAEIARKRGQKERDMAPVLHQDLRACAMHFLYL